MPLATLKLQSCPTASADRVDVEMDMPMKPWSRRFPFAFPNWMVGRVRRTFWPAVSMIPPNNQSGSEAEQSSINTARTPEREAVPLPIRPSAFAWARIVRVGVIGFAVGLVAALVFNFAFHLLWPTLVGMAFALIGAGAATASLVQNIREAEYGYTTLPWRTGELELRDPADGWIVVPAGAGVRFDSLKEAREWSASVPLATSSDSSDGGTDPSE